MTSNQREFLEAYYEACSTSNANDWMKAALMAKQMYNDEHPSSEEEKAIKKIWEDKP